MHHNLNHLNHVLKVVIIFALDLNKNLTFWKMLLACDLSFKPCWLKMPKTTTTRTRHLGKIGHTKLFLLIAVLDICKRGLFQTNYQPSVKLDMYRLDLNVPRFIFKKSFVYTLTDYVLLAYFTGGTSFHFKNACRRSKFRSGWRINNQRWL